MKLQTAIVLTLCVAFGVLFALILFNVGQVTLDRALATPTPNEYQIFREYLKTLAPK